MLLRLNRQCLAGNVISVLPEGITHAVSSGFWDALVRLKDALWNILLCLRKAVSRSQVS